MPIRILIADDHGVIRAGLRALLEKESDLQVVGEAANGEEAQRCAGELRPDVLLLDVTMPGLDGIQVTRNLTQTLPQTRILILTLHEGVSMLREAVSAGAAGYIVKRAIDTELLGAIRTVMNGELYIHPTMAQSLFKDLSPRNENHSAQGMLLSPRESEVLRLIARGLTNRQIAKNLSLSIRTVESHRANLINKLGSNNRAELIRFAIEHHMID
jgi:two-component system, NarL family, response regulator NreC